jgi:hypothetical protein
MRRRSNRMKEHEFEPAKIISRPDAKQKEPSDPKAPTDVTEVDPVPITETAQAEPSDPKATEGESFDGILDRFTGKAKGKAVWAGPFDMQQNGVFKDLYGATVDQAAREIKGIIITTIFHAYLLIGYYLLAVYFDSDESQAFSRNPYKNTSINDLAKRDDIPFTRQKLTDCIKAAAVDMELRKRGHHFDHLHYEHLLQLGRLKKPEQRLEKAREANDDKLTSGELKKIIDNMFGKTPSQDKQIARALTRQLRDFVKLTEDEDVQGFLEDKDRSAVLDHTEIAQLLEFSGKFREAVEDSEEMLKQLEDNLRENFVEKQPKKDQDSGKVLLDS